MEKMFGTCRILCVLWIWKCVADCGACERFKSFCAFFTKKLKYIVWGSTFLKEVTLSTFVCETICIILSFQTWQKIPLSMKSINVEKIRFGWHLCFFLEFEKITMKVLLFYGLKCLCLFNMGNAKLSTPIDNTQKKRNNNYPAHVFHYSELSLFSSYFLILCGGAYGR